MTFMKTLGVNRFVILITSVMMMVLLSCQSGRIPCPETKYAKLKNSTGRKNTFVYTAQAEQPVDYNYGKPKTTRAVSNVTVEEWDCPRPGEKKYLPKTIKENIRKNYKKIKQQEANATTTN